MIGSIKFRFESYFYDLLKKHSWGENINILTLLPWCCELNSYSGSLRWQSRIPDPDSNLAVYSGNRKIDISATSRKSMKSIYVRVVEYRKFDKKKKENKKNPVKLWKKWFRLIQVRFVNIYIIWLFRKLYRDELFMWQNTIGKTIFGKSGKELSVKREHSVRIECSYWTKYTLTHTCGDENIVIIQWSVKRMWNNSEKRWIIHHGGESFHIQW